MFTVIRKLIMHQGVTFLHTVEAVECFVIFHYVVPFMIFIFHMPMNCLF
jgi:hypothetical protein